MTDQTVAEATSPAEPEAVPEGAPEGREATPGPAPRAAGTAALIRARGLTKRFGDFTAVNGVDFDVQPGEAFGFLGPTGAGKTSTMRMIACVSPPSEGKLRVFDLDPGADGPNIRTDFFPACPFDDSAGRTRSSP